MLQRYDVDLLTDDFSLFPTPHTYTVSQVLNVKKEVIKIAQNMVNSGRSIKIE